MNKKNLEILGLEDGATAEEIKAAYEALRAKYLEERFMDGEAGNNAAKMLGKIETAYSELLTELKESSYEDGENSFAKVEQLIKDGNLQEAQRVLDGFNERGAQWHYLQSVLFYRKNWMNESKKQLEIAIQLEPDNAKYKEAYRKLIDKINYDANATGGAGSANGSAYQGQSMNYTQPDEQMGGDFCSWCAQCIVCNACLNLGLNCCCSCR